MAKNTLHVCVFHQPDNMLFAHSHAMPVDSRFIRLRLTTGFTDAAQRISAPISWGGPPVLQRRNR
jgi:hypothetical protein